mgnify:CR=1 FL=1
MSRIVKPERTMWRDMQLSLRHRKWGYDCPAVDIDFLFCEYDNGSPIAIIEYKWINAAAVDCNNNSSFTAIRKLCDSAGIYFFVTRYRTSPYQFRVMSGNAKARYLLNSLGINNVWISEEDFVSLLYNIRGRVIPNTVVDFINDDESQLRSAQ